MKKIILVITFVCFTTPCISKEYECRWTGEAGIFWATTITTETLNKPASEQCGWLRKLSINEYNHCVERHNTYIRAYSDGHCKELGTKKYNIDGSDCEIKYVIETGEGAGYGCSGKDSDLAMPKLKRIYNKDFNSHT